MYSAEPGSESKHYTEKNPLEYIEVLPNGERGLRLECVSSGVSGPPRIRGWMWQWKNNAEATHLLPVSGGFHKIVLHYEWFWGMKEGWESHLCNIIQNLCSVLQQATMTCICGETESVSIVGWCSAIPPKSETTVTKLVAGHLQGIHNWLTSSVSAEYFWEEGVLTFPRWWGYKSRGRISFLDCSQRSHIAAYATHAQGFDALWSLSWNSY